MESKELIPHLFRAEYIKIVSVLCSRFGFEQLEIAEDIASETFLTATQAWGLEGIPANPTAWLYSVAKNKAKNYINRVRIFDDKISTELKNTSLIDLTTDIDLSEQNILDSQLLMMFTLCHPSISVEAQIGLSLRILCGFGITEIADAFLTNKEAINKRLYRAKERLKQEMIRIELADISHSDDRLMAVLTTIYLLFNEGYYSVNQNKSVRKELCFEAIRLCSMLIENKSTNKAEVNALMALMCFHASRFEARQNAAGELLLYDEQESALWDEDLIMKAGYFLMAAQKGNTISKYHLEAGIAYWHTVKEESLEKWENILGYYNQLLLIAYSPVAELNRIYALSKVQGKEIAIKEAEKNVKDKSHFYQLLLGELYTGLDNDKARMHLRYAYELTSSIAEKAILANKIQKIK